MSATPALIKELRARTGAGMLDCKKTLDETGGDIDAAIETLRKKGAASADKKAGRIVAEGVIATAASTAASALVEINCETDFVAKDPSFREYADKVAAAVLAAAPRNIESVAALTLDHGHTVESARRELIAKIGENISLRRFAIVKAEGGAVSTYLHGTRIGVMVAVTGGNPQLGRDIAMHVAASRPFCVSEADMPAEALAREKAIFAAQAAESGKPAPIVEKMVAGRMKKFLKENTLLGQPFIKDPERSVAQLVSAAGATVEQMVRFEVGEGLEKRPDDFVAEVMAQAQASATAAGKPTAS